MKEEKRKLWFSQEQADDIARKDPDKEITFGILENGRIVEYTQATFVAAVDSGSKWPDIKLLGIGTFHHSEPRS